MRISIVTDSTAYLPEGFAQRHSITVVPLHVAVDGAGRLDGVDFGPAELAGALAEHRRVTTSRPTPGEMAAVYRDVLSSSDLIVSVHLSRELSGTWEAARLAAEEIDPSRIRVVDSRATGMGLGFSVLRACAAVAAGRSHAEVEDAATSAAAQTRMFFCVETLEHLRRGGRIGTTAALVGTALAVKPLLHVEDGRIVPLEKVRTMSRAVGRLVDLAAAAAGDGPGRPRGAPPRGPGTCRGTGHAAGRTSARLDGVRDLGGRRGDRRAHGRRRAGRRGAAGRTGQPPTDPRQSRVPKP